MNCVGVVDRIIVSTVHRENAARINIGLRNTISQCGGDGRVLVRVERETMRHPGPLDGKKLLRSPGPSSSFLGALMLELPQRRHIGKSVYLENSPPDLSHVSSHASHRLEYTTLLSLCIPWPNCRHATPLSRFRIAYRPSDIAARSVFGTVARCDRRQLQLRRCGETSSCLDLLLFYLHCLSAVLTLPYFVLRALCFSTFEAFSSAVWRHHSKMSTAP
jgi:hypothetical protein